MEENKKILLSGKLSGTRTKTSELEKIENPDDIESFLLYFSKLNIEIDNYSELESNIVYINDDQELLNNISSILESKYISIHTIENFSRLYITTDSSITYSIRLNKVSSAIIGTIISSEKIIKYAINSFNFIKWCNSKNIDIKALYDIPTYIKLLTNDVDPFKTVENYLTQYSNYTLTETNNEKNNITICVFIYKFGQILSEYIDRFDLATVSRLINENGYYEGNSFNNNGNCTILIEYKNVHTAISNISNEIAEKFIDKAYIISPLNRIAPKFRNDTPSLIQEIYAEDLSIAILNELYNNNIPVKLDYERNQYVITCKFKNFSNIITLANAIFSEAFFTLFEQTPELHIECFVKE